MVIVAVRDSNDDVAVDALCLVFQYRLRPPLFLTPSAVCSNLIHAGPAPCYVDKQTITYHSTPSPKIAHIPLHRTTRRTPTQKTNHNQDRKHGHHLHLRTPSPSRPIHPPNKTPNTNNHNHSPSTQPASPKSPQTPAPPPSPPQQPTNTTAPPPGTTPSSTPSCSPSSPRPPRPNPQNPQPTAAVTNLQSTARLSSTSVIRGAWAVRRTLLLLRLRQRRERSRRAWAAAACTARAARTGTTSAMGCGVSSTRVERARGWILW